MQSYLWLHKHTFVTDVGERGSHHDENRAGSGDSTETAAASSSATTRESLTVASSPRSVQWHSAAGNGGANGDIDGR